MPFNFIKMHGIGNDFVVINGLESPFTLAQNEIARIADRHFGIGFDQMLVIQPPSQIGVDYDVRIFNADGREVGQCGNGVRCVGRFLHDSGLVRKKNIVLATPTRRVEVYIEEDNQVTVNMGVPNFVPAQIPFKTDRRASVYTLTINQNKVEMGVVSLGNPHAVIKVDDIETAPVATIGPLLAKHPDFPEGVNVGFMQVVNRSQIKLRVYERGSGETLACGSGACAAVVVAQQQGLLDQQANVDLPGGCLQVRWQGEETPVWATGPTEIVFVGEWLL